MLEETECLQAQWIGESLSGTGLDPPVKDAELDELSVKPERFRFKAMWLECEECDQPKL